MLLKSSHPHHIHILSDSWHSSKTSAPPFLREAEFLKKEQETSDSVLRRACFCQYLQYSTVTTSKKNEDCRDEK